MPDTLEGLELCAKYMDDESKAWLNGLKEGNLGISLTDKGLQAGQVGPSGQVQCGDVKEQTRVICGPLPPNFFVLPGQARPASNLPVPQWSPRTTPLKSP